MSLRSDFFKEKSSKRFNKHDVVVVVVVVVVIYVSTCSKALATVCISHSSAFT